MSQTNEITTTRARSALRIEYDLATTADVVALTYLFKDFFAESDYDDAGITYSPNRAAAWLRDVIGRGSFPHVVARVDNKIVGVISWSMDHSFSEEPIAILHTLYVRPEHRRSAIGRFLVSTAMDIARHEGACSFSAPIASGVKSGIENMFKKAGFKSSGKIMTRAL